jgi:ABC-type transport system involved in multi-copper enzyme maturation permease subunit
VSDIATTPAAERPAGPARAGLPWNLWRRQVGAVMRLELRKNFSGTRAIWLYLLAFSPLLILLMRVILPRAVSDPANIGEATQGLAILFQTFMLRVVIFLACVAIFGNLIRREMLDRSLHYYFLSPMRREVLVVGKYLTGLVVSVTVFGLMTLLAFVLAYLPHQGSVVQEFLTRGPGLGQLGAYLLVTVLACVGYGAVFLTFGSFVKSPALPALVVFGWEGLQVFLPPLLKKMSVIHYLQGLCPVPVPLGPFAIPADAPSPWVAVPGLLIFSALLLALSAWKVRRMEVSYEED